MPRRLSPAEEEIQNYVNRAQQGLVGQNPKDQAMARSRDPRIARQGQKAMSWRNTDNLANQDALMRDNERAAKEQAAADKQAAADAAKAARQQEARDVRSAAAQGMDTTTDIQTGRTTIARNPDGSPAWKTGEVGAPYRAPDKVTETVVTRPTGEQYRPLSNPMVPDDGSIASTPGTATRTTEQQWIQDRRDSHGNVTPTPLPVATDKKTGQQTVEIKDATGAPQKQLVGVDPVADERNRRITAAQGRLENLSLAKNQIQQARAIYGPQFEPIKKAYDEAQAKWKPFTEDGIERRKIGTVSRWGRVNEQGIWRPISDQDAAAYNQRKAQARQQLDIAEKAYNEGKPRMDNIQSEEDRIDLERLRAFEEKHRAENDLPADDSYISRLLAADQGTQTPEQKAAEAIRSQVPQTEAGQPTGQAAQPVLDAPTQDAFKSLQGLSGVTLESRNGWTALNRNGQWIGSLEDDNGKPLVTLKDAARDSEDVIKIVRDTENGVPLYLRDNRQRPKLTEEANQVAGVFRVLGDNTLTADQKTESLRGMQLDPLTIRRKVDDGLMSVQTGKMLLKNLWNDSLDVTDSGPAGFQEWLKNSTTAADKALSEKYGKSLTDPNAPGRVYQQATDRSGIPGVMVPGLRSTYSKANQQQVGMDFARHWATTNAGKPGVTRAQIKELYANAGQLSDGITGKVASGVNALRDIVVNDVIGSMVGMGAGAIGDASAAEAALFGADGAKEMLAESMRLRNRDFANWTNGLKRTTEKLRTAEGRQIASNLDTKLDAFQRTIDEEADQPNPDQGRIDAAEQQVREAALAVHNLAPDESWPVTLDNLDPNKDGTLGMALADYKATGDPRMFALYKERLLMNNGRRQLSKEMQEKTAAQRGGFLGSVAQAQHVGWQELGTELLADAAVLVTGGGSKLIQKGLKAAGAVGKAERLEAAGAKIGKALDSAWNAGIKQGTLAKPLTTLDKARNVGVRVAQAGIGEGIEEVLVSPGEDNPTPVEDFLVGTLGGITLAPAGLLAQSIRKDAIAPTETKLNENFARSYNATNAGTKDFQPVTPETVGIARSLTNESSAREAIQTITQAVQTHNDAWADTPQDAAIRGQARQTASDAVGAMQLRSEDAMEAAREIEQTQDPARKTALTGIAKVAAGNEAQLTPNERKAIAATKTAEGADYFQAIQNPDGSVSEYLTPEARQELSATAPAVARLASWRPVPGMPSTATTQTNVAQPQAQVGGTAPAVVSQEVQPQVPEAQPGATGVGPEVQGGGRAPLAGAGESPAVTITPQGQAPTDSLPDGQPAPTSGDGGQPAADQTPDDPFDATEKDAVSLQREMEAETVADEVQQRVLKRLPGMKGRIRISDTRFALPDGKEMKTGGLYADMQGVVLTLPDIADELDNVDGDVEAVADSLERLALTHEIVHVVQFQALQDAWEDSGRPGELMDFFNETYGRMAKELGPDVMKEAAKIYGKDAWNAIDEPMRAAEVVRMLVESRLNPDAPDTSELFRAVRIANSATFIDLLKRAVEKLVAMLKSGELPADVREEVDKIEALYRELTQTTDETRQPQPQAKRSRETQQARDQGTTEGTAGGNADVQPAAENAGEQAAAPAAAVEGNQSQSIKIDPRNRNQFPGEDYPVPPNVVFIQPRGLDTMPMTDKVFTFPYDGTAEDAAKVGAKAFMQLDSQFNGMSQRESLFRASGDDGMTKFRMSMDMVHDRVRVESFAQKRQKLPDATPSPSETRSKLGDAPANSITQAEAAKQITKDQAAEILKESDALKGRPIRTYEQAVAANQIHMGTRIPEWSAFPFSGEVVEGTPVQDTTGISELTHAPTLFPTSTAAGSGNCEWCGHQPIKGGYHIKHDGKKWTMVVGSECIMHFAGISGNQMAADAKETVATETLKAIGDARTQLDREFRYTSKGSYGKTFSQWRSREAEAISTKLFNLRGNIREDSGRSALSRWMNAKKAEITSTLAEFSELMANPETTDLRIKWREAALRDADMRSKAQYDPQWKRDEAAKYAERLRTELAELKGETPKPEPQNIAEPANSPQGKEIELTTKAINERFLGDNMPADIQDRFKAVRERIGDEGILWLAKKIRSDMAIGDNGMKGYFPMISDFEANEALAERYRKSWSPTQDTDTRQESPSPAPTAATPTKPAEASASGAGETPSKPAKRPRQIDSPARREAFRLLNAPDTKLANINKIIGDYGRISMPPANFALIRAKKGKKLTDKEQQLWNRYQGEYDSAIFKNQLPNTKEGKVAQEILGLIYAPHGEGIAPNVMARNLGFDKPDQVWEMIRRDLATVLKPQQENPLEIENPDAQQIAKVEAEQAKVAKQNAEFDAANTPENGEPIEVSAFTPEMKGKFVTVDGERMKVVDVEWNSFLGMAESITLEDGTRFGRQVLGDEDVVYVEVEKTAEAKKPAPQSAMDRKNADNKELFADDGGFKLSQEATQDGDKIAAERKAKEEAKAAADKAQGGLFEAETPMPASTAGSKKLDDFGEKMRGARKDMQPSIDKDLTDDDIASKPLSEIWPKKEVDAIEDKSVAAFAHAARALVPAKPRSGYKLRRWVETVKMARTLMRSLGDIGVDPFIAKIRAEGSRDLNGFADTVQVLREIDRQQWSRVEDVKNYPDSYRYDEGKQVPSPFADAKVDGRRVRADDLATLTDAINKALGAEAQPSKMKFQVRQRNSDGRIFINKDGDPLRRTLKEFADSKEAFDFIRDNYADLVAAWEKVKESDNVKEADLRTRDNRPRAGQDYRKGKDATPEMFMEAFGFRGVEFGNWVGQGANSKERQGMLNQAYDALQDLANITGIPTRAISLEGQLGLAFGSRGSGSASAHYEPGNIVINLTKTRGAGTLAHEWFHALDHYFQRKRPNKKADRSQGNYLTFQPETMMVHKPSGQMLTRRRFEEMMGKNAGIRPAYANPAEWEAVQGVRPEVEEAFTELVNTLKDSPMAKRAGKIDKGKSDGYWSRIIEIAARSFENYTIAKMMRDGYHNDYLANVTPASEFVRDAGRYPYHLPEEMEVVEKAFDNLFATIDTKETDKGTALFSSPSAKPEPFYSQLARTLEAKMPKQAPVDQVVSIATSGAKAEEIKWSGLVQKSQELAKENGGKVDKAALLDWLANEGTVRFDEVTLGESIIANIAAKYGYTVDTSYEDGVFIDKNGEMVEDDDLPPALLKEIENIQDSKYAQYVLPGGENYREVVLAMPHTTKAQYVIAYKDGSGQLGGLTFDTEAEAKAEMADMFGGRNDLEVQPFYREKAVSEYTSSHFPDVPNYVAHMRLNERTDADGKPGLFIEELQSDRHQAGRDKGYRDDEKLKRDRELYDIAKIYAAIGRNPDMTTEKSQEILAGLNQRLKAIGAVAADINPFLEKYGDFTRPFSEGEGQIAPAPFEKTWPLALFKRALRDAVASGKDWIGWTVGDTQNDRFDLSKQVDEVQWDNIDGYGKKIAISFKKKGENRLTDGGIHNAEKLPDVVGKELAEKIIAKAQGPDANEHGSFSGLDLKVGGSGMKGFYDNILPSMIGEYVKKNGFNGKVTRSNVITKSGRGGEQFTIKKIGPSFVVYDGQGRESSVHRTKEAAESRVKEFTEETTPIWRIDITPEMRKGVSMGQALFSSPSPQRATQVVKVQIPEGFPDASEGVKPMVKWAKENVKGSFPSPALNADVEVTSYGINHTAAQLARNPQRMRVIAGLPSLIKAARIVTPQTGKNIQMHALVEIDDQIQVARITVEERTGDSRGPWNRFYDIKGLEVKSALDAMSAFPSITEGSLLAIPGREVTMDQLAEIVNMAENRGTRLFSSPSAPKSPTLAQAIADPANAETLKSVKAGKVNALPAWQFLTAKKAKVGLSDAEEKQLGEVETALREAMPKQNETALAASPSGNRDAEYLAAVERGDMETAQRMVDEAAKAAGYDIGPLFHGSPNTEIKEFRRGFWTSDQDRASGYLNINGQGKVYRAYLKIDRPYKVHSENTGLFHRIGYEGKKGDFHDGAITDGTYDSPTVAVVVSSEQIKSADPVTYDADGNVIPLSQRFNPAKDSILFSSPSQPRLKESDYARHAELEAKHNAGTITQAETEEAQRLVEAAAKAAGYNLGPVWHGTGRWGKDQKFTVFDSKQDVTVYRVDGQEVKRLDSDGESISYYDDEQLADGYHYGALTDAATMGAEEALKFRAKEEGNNSPHVRDLRRLVGKNVTYGTEERRTGDGFYFSGNENYGIVARSKNKIRAYLKLENPAKVDESAVEGAGSKWKKDRLIAKGYDGAIFNAPWNPLEQVVAFYPNQIKSADPFTGVPLRKRFNPQSDSILFSSPSVRGKEPSRPIPDSPSEGAFMRAIDRYSEETGTKRRRENPDRFEEIMKEEEAIDAANEQELQKWLDEIPQNQPITFTRDGRYGPHYYTVTKNTTDPARPWRTTYWSTYPRPDWTADEEIEYEDLFKKTRWVDSSNPQWQTWQNRLNDLGSRPTTTDQTRILATGHDESKTRLDAVKHAMSMAGTRNPRIGSLFSSPSSSSGKRRSDPVLDAIKALVRSPEKKADTYGKMNNMVAGVRRRFDSGRLKQEMSKKGIDAAKYTQLRDIAILEAIAKALPMEMRGKLLGSIRQLSELSTERGREQRILKLLPKIEQALEKHLRTLYRKDIRKIIDKGQPRPNDSRNRRGRIGAVGHAIIEQAVDAMTKDSGAAMAEAAALRDVIESEYDANGNHVPMDLDTMEEYEGKAMALELFADYQNADSKRLEQALEFLENVYDESRNQWLDVLADRKAKREADIEALREAIKAPDFITGAMLKAARDKSEKPLPYAGNAVLEWISSAYNLFDRLKENTTDPQAIAWVDEQQKKLRDARGAYDDAVESERVAMEEAMERIFKTRTGWVGKFDLDPILHRLSQRTDEHGITVLEGKSTEEISVPISVAESLVRREVSGFDYKGKRYEITDMDMPALQEAWEQFNDLPEKAQAKRRVIKFTRINSFGSRENMGKISQLEGLKEWLAMRQADFFEKYEAQGWDETTFAQLDKWLKPEVKEFGLWMVERMREQQGELDGKHREEFGIGMKLVENYFPGLFESAGNQDSNVTPDGVDTAVRAKTASSLKTRVAHLARPKQMNAISMFLSNRAQTHFFMTHATPLREILQVMRSKAANEAVRVKVGEGYARSMIRELKLIETNGVLNADGILEAERIMRKVTSGYALATLGLKLSTLAINTTAVMNTLLGVPVGTLAKGFSREYLGDVKRFFNTPAIIRRLKHGTSHEVRLAAQGGIGSQPLSAGGRRVAQTSLQGINWWDTFSNSVLGAAAYRAALEEARKAGLSEAQAVKKAEDLIDQLSATVMQPNNLLSRSMGEAKLTASPMGQLMFMFMTETRKNAAIAAYAARKLVTGKGAMSRGMAAQQLIVLLGFYSALGHVIRSAYQAAFKSEDDEPEEVLARFAKRMSDAKQWTYALATEHLRGIPFAGEFLSRTIGEGVNAIDAIPGEQVRMFDSSPNPLNRGVKGAFGLSAAMDDKATPEDQAQAIIDAIQGVMGMSQETAAIAQLGNVAEDALGLLTSNGKELSEAERFKRMKSRMSKFMRDWREKNGNVGDDPVKQEQRRIEAAEFLQNQLNALNPQQRARYIDALKGKVSEEVREMVSP